MRKREATLYLVFNVVERLSGNWRALNGGQSPDGAGPGGLGLNSGALPAGLLSTAIGTRLPFLHLWVTLRR